MTVTKFELKVETGSKCFSSVDLDSVQEGWVLNMGRDHDPETLAVFDTKEEALQALESYTSTAYVSYFFSGTLVEMEEFYVDEVEYTEEGDFVDCSGSWMAKLDRSRLDDFIKEQEEDEDE